MKNLKYLLISLIVIFLDQLTKTIVLMKMNLGESIPILGNFLRFTHLRNYGAAFSFSFGNASLNKLLFTIASFLAIIFFIYLLYKSKDKMTNVIYSLIIGGALGNLIDRIRLGGVTDFIDSDFPDFIMERWPVFNIADSSIVIAMILFIILEIISKIREKDKDL